jgi:alkaline phosphatase
MGMRPSPHGTSDEAGQVLPTVLRIGRRAFLERGALWLLAFASGSRFMRSVGEELSDAPLLKIGLLTDLHYADRPPAGTRFYRETQAKLRECVDRFNAVMPDFVVELGDFIDAAETVQGELSYLRTIEAEFARLRSPRHYVLGNHCVWTLTKEQFLDNCGAREPFYSFDQGPLHFVVLDACFRADGLAYGARNNVWTDTEVPPQERDWLKADLKRAERPAVIFIHQRLDVENEYGVKSAPAVRKILEESGKVRAVFQGHSHQNDYREINGIHYVTLAAMIEGSGMEHNACGLMSVFKDGAIQLQGFRQQKSYHLAGSEPRVRRWP